MIDDDDVDIDLELGSDPSPPKRRKRGARGAGRASDAQAAGKPQIEDEGASGEQGVTVVPEQRQGLLHRIMAPIAGLINRIPVPRFNLKSFLVGLAVLVLLIAVVDNWAATRLSFIGLHADVPSSVVIAVAFALGFVAAWVILSRRRGEPEE